MLLSNRYQFSNMFLFFLLLNLSKTIQILIGLFNIGLGPGRTNMQPDNLPYLGAAYWLGAVVKSFLSFNVLSNDNVHERILVLC